MAFENIPFRVAEIPADNADGINFGEKARRQTKVRCRTAENPIALAERRFERVKRDRTNYC
jgi:hypothetical protein